MINNIIMNLILASSIFSLFFSSPSSNKITSNAESWEGKYYKKGESARCADFVGSMVIKSGKLPPTEYQKCTSWLKWGTPVSISDLRRGDIIIYAKSGGYNHIGIYCGDGMIIHRPTKSKAVCKLNYKYRKIIGIRRG